jgi:hypothetical protein
MLVSGQLFARPNMLNKTREALLSYSFIEEKTEELTKKIKEKTLGDYSEKLLILAPFVTGKVQFNAMDINFYYDHRNAQEAGVNYNLKF